MGIIYLPTPYNIYWYYSMYGLHCISPQGFRRTLYILYKYICYLILWMM